MSANRIPDQLAYLLITTCVLGTLASCGGQSTSEAPTLTYWRTLSGAAGDAQEELVRRFNTERPSVHVKTEFQGSYSDLRTKLIASAASNTGPNVSLLGTYEILEMKKAGLLVDLRPYLDGANGIDTSQWPGTLRAGGELDGGIYWLPFNVSVPVLYYNRDALAAANLAGPPATWSEFYAAARAMTVRDADGKVVRVGVALWDDLWPLVSMIWSEGGELTNRDYSSITLNNPAAVKVLQELQKLIQEGAASVGVAATGGHRALFKQGGAAMILDSPAPFEEIFSQSSGFAPEACAFPVGSAGAVYAPGGGGLVMLASTPEQERIAAWDFIRFMLSPKELAHFAHRSGYVAFTKEAQVELALTLEEPNYRRIYAALPNIRGDFSVNMSPAIRNAFTEAYQKAFIQNANVQTVLDEADAKAEAEIKRATSGS